LREPLFNPDNPEQLVAKVMEGDEKAWEHITELFYQPLVLFVNSMTHRMDIAEELVQDVFVNFWTKRDRIEINTSLKAYLYRAARNHTLNHIKRNKFEMNYQQSLKPDYSYNSTDTKIGYSELEQQLNKSIEELPETRRDIFKLSRFEDMTYKEISDTLEIPIRQVHYQIGLALKELREKVQHLVDYKL
jgi:RNA polymerase sigma-70 factor (ECF subfamily)